MAASDARPLPIKNTAFRVTFPILDNTGAPVTGAAGLDSEVSKDGGAFADCTNEATEIGTSGIYYLDLTSTEMNADTVAVQVKTSTTDAKPSVLIFYPQELGDIKVDTESNAGTAITAAAGIQEVKVASVAANAINASAIADNAIDAGAIAADAITAAKIADGAIDAATFAAGAINAAAIATDAIDADALAADAVTEIQSGLSTLTAAGVRTAVGLASANLDTQLGDLPTANEIADAFLDRTDGVETGITPRGTLRALLAALAGVATGGSSTTITLKNPSGGTTRVTLTVDADGNRSASVLNV